MCVCVCVQCRRVVYYILRWWIRHAKRPGTIAPTTLSLSLSKCVLKWFCLTPPFLLLSLQVLVDRMSSYMHVFTLYSAIRPFGCSVMFGSYSASEGPQLFMTDPSGVCWVGSFSLSVWLPPNLLLMLLWCRVTMHVQLARQSKQPKQS